jgi:hypothetical protein
MENPRLGEGKSGQAKLTIYYYDAKMPIEYV